MFSDNLILVSAVSRLSEAVLMMSILVGVDSVPVHGQMQSLLCSEGEWLLL